MEVAPLLSEPYKSSITFFLNGRRVDVENPQPEMTLLEWLRNNGLTGCKLGCGEGTLLPKIRVLYMQAFRHPETKNCSKYFFLFN